MSPYLCLTTMLQCYCATRYRGGNFEQKDGSQVHRERRGVRFNRGGGASQGLLGCEHQQGDSQGWRRRRRSLALHDRHEQGKGHKGARDRVQHLLRVRADGRRHQGGLVRHVPGEAHRPLGALLTGRPSSSAIMSAPRLSKGKGFVCGRIWLHWASWLRWR